MPVTVERIERALIQLATIIARDGDGHVYVPIMDRLEAELIKARTVEHPVARARRLLDAYDERRSQTSASDTPKEG